MVSDTPAGSGGPSGASEYRHGVERGAAWRREDGVLRALPSQLKNLRKFWPKGTGGNMFWFQRIPGWGYRDHLFFAMHPWKANKLAESAEFWAALGLTTDSTSATFLRGFVDGALGFAPADGGE